MNIERIGIEWMLGLGNSPNVKIVVDDKDKRPDRYEFIPPMVFAQDPESGIHHFIVYAPPKDPKNGDMLGYGGREMSFTLTNGNELKSNDWWSGGAYGLTQVLGEGFVDVSVKNRMAGTYTHGWAMPVSTLRKMLPDNVYIVPEQVGAHLHHNVSVDPDNVVKPNEDYWEYRFDGMFFKRRL
jgi:hypothetical protein